MDNSNSPDTPEMKGQVQNSTARTPPEPGHDGPEGCEQWAGRRRRRKRWVTLFSGASLVSPHLDNTTLFEEICQILQGHIIIESLHIDCSAVRVLLRVHRGA